MTSHENFELFHFLIVTCTLNHTYFCWRACCKKKTKPSFSGLFDLGHGRKIHMECSGTGAPVVVLISGLRDRTDSWSASDPENPSPTVFSEISKTTRVCAYDRPGTVTMTTTGVEKSRSHAIKQPVTIKDSVSDLHALLIASNEAGPYILVGHSAGGLIARLYTSEYPKNVSGIVLVDALSENLHTRMSKADWHYFNDQLNGIQKELVNYEDYENIDFVTSFKQLRPLPKRPMIILTADKAPDFESIKAAGRLPQGMPQDFPKTLWNAQIKAQQYLAHLYPDAKHITNTNSGHYIHQEQPQIVINAIIDIINQVRKNSKPALSIEENTESKQIRFRDTTPSEVTNRSVSYKLTDFRYHPPKRGRDV